MKFNYVSAAQQVIFGAGALDQLAEAVAAFGWQRLVLYTLPRFQATGVVARLETLLGSRLTAVYAAVQPHVHQDQVAAAVALAGSHQADALIGLGGGSAIGLAKATSLALEAQRIGRPARARFPTDQPLIAVIAIPTTYAGSEMTPIYGVTQVIDGQSRKVTVTDAKVTPKLTIYDPELTLSMPAGITAASAINALAHCVEAVYSITRNPLATAAALQGVSHITQALPLAVAHGADVAARTELLAGAYLAASAIATTKIGLHHGVCHVLGGTAAVPHGIAHAIMLPHVMRFNADAVTAELAAVARSMALTGANEAELAEKAAQSIYDLISRSALPQRLRDAGVNKADLPRLAQLALQSQAVQNNPKPITGAAAVEAVLQAAW
jgi:maleylacetate reductase